MKKMMMILVAMLTIAVSARAMSYEQARNEALFLTDKMAYELNLTDEQYEAAYEINLDYLMGVTSRHDVFGTYWERRNLDLSYILLDWQWNAYLAASYFYRPLYWEAGYWHFGVYARYPYRDYFYFGRPHFYATYRGGHAWHLHGSRGYYYGRRSHFRAPGRVHVGLHDRWTRGDFRGTHRSSTRVTGRGGSRGSIGNHRGMDNRRIGSSTNRGVNRGHNYDNNGVRSRGYNYDNNGGRNRSYNYDNNGGRNRSSIGSSGIGSRNVEGHRSYGSDRSSMGSSRSNYSTPSRSFGNSSSRSSMGSNRSSSFGGSRSSASFGGSRSSSSFGGGRSSASFGGSRGGGSFSGGGSRGGGSFSGGSHGGSHGGGHVGGRR